MRFSCQAKVLQREFWTYNVVPQFPGLQMHREAKTFTLYEKLMRIFRRLAAPCRAISTWQKVKKKETRETYLQWVEEGLLVTWTHTWPSFASCQLPLWSDRSWPDIRHRFLAFIRLRRLSSVGGRQGEWMNKGLRTSFYQTQNEVICILCGRRWSCSENIIWKIVVLRQEPTFTLFLPIFFIRFHKMRLINYVA